MVSQKEKRKRNKSIIILEIFLLQLLFINSINGQVIDTINVCSINNLTNGYYYVIDTINNYEGVFIDGNKEGLFITYHKNSNKIFKEEYFQKSILNGVSKWFHYNGNLRQIGYFLNGNKNGFFIDYFDDGISILYEKLYYNNQIYGFSRTYNEDGSIQQEYFPIIYSNVDGIVFQNYDDIIYILYYRNNELVKKEKILIKENKVEIKQLKVD